MNTPVPEKPFLGITLRTALMSWLVSIATLLIFVAVIIPQQKSTFLENLESKAHGVAVSLRDVAAGAAVNEDFSAVVDHCKEMLKGDESLDYLVITKKDGFALIHERTVWRADELAGPEWRPANRVPGGRIDSLPPFHRRVYHYSQPFDYSGIEWGWIHVGLSLQRYDRSVADVYHRTWVLAVLCIALSLFASAAYARRLVRPILDLRRVVRKVADGDLAARAVVERDDELGNLAGSVNSMTGALLRRDNILHSVRFAAQQFLAGAQWEEVIGSVLAKIGEASATCRVRLFVNQTSDDGRIRSLQRFQWVANQAPDAVTAAPDLTLDWTHPGLRGRVDALRASEFVTFSGRDWTPDERAVLESQGIHSLLLIPVHVEGDWWGLLGLEDCRDHRVWSAAERDSLRAAADMLGARIARQHTQDALLGAKEAAEAANRAKSQFLANMSHEIRTPITGVVGMLRLLQRTPLDDKQQRYVTNSVASADALLKVIGDILDFSKIEAGKFSLEHATFSVPDTLDVSLRLLAAQAEAKGVELVARVEEDVPRLLLGDPDRLQQILLNLLSNAVKFTDRGSVILSCSVQESATDTVLLRFQVQDTGAGIAPEQQALIFDAFCQADNSMSRAHGGTGLGLTISRQLTRLMGGQIGVESRLGHGSTFWFTARLGRPDPEPAHVHPHSLVDLRGLRVLVVDDCPVSRGVVRTYIRKWKGLAEEAADASSALEILRAAAERSEPFSVAIIDWRLPGLDGFDLARLLRQDPALGATGLVLLSGVDQARLPARGPETGFVATLSKPVRKSELYDAIVRAANGQLLDQHPTPTSLAPTLPPVPGPGPAPSASVLLAEDNEINQEVASEMLASLGYTCRCVRNGREAVEAVREGFPDLVLMDCQMPEMDGYEATRNIRLWETREAPEGRRGKRLPIVALTAHAMTGDRERCLDAGMDDYLTKPLEPAELARTLAHWLPTPAPTPTAPETTPSHPSPSSPPSHSSHPTPTPAPQPVPSSIPPFDFTSLLHRCMGNQNLAQRLVQKFVAQAGHDLRELESGIRDRDAARVRLVAHRLNGSAANVSAERIRDHAGQLEIAARDGHLDPAPGLLDQLRADFAAAEAANPGTPPSNSTPTSSPAPPPAPTPTPPPPA